jgi:filamentous hemagglutinin family protein
MASHKGLKAVFRPKLVALAVASCFVTSTTLANPTGPTVVHGAATIHQAGNLLQVTNTPSAIINWQSFSIGANEITRFIQQSQASAVLNRVVGAGGAIDPSVILGALQSNGRVFLLNPSGILFGAGAQVDVAGLVASSLNLSNADFLANRLNFTALPGAGSVVNQGNITTGSGGGVYLIGPAVSNNGIITSPQGEVILAAGNSVELVEPGTPNLRVEISAPDNEARNLGQIVADSGRVGIYAGLINHSGTLRADTVQVGKNGEILLKASKNIALEPGSVISASGAPGGVHDGGTVRIVADDALDMRQGSAVHVDGGVDGGNGGFLELSGKQKIALNGEFTGRARKDGYKNGSLLLDPLNISIGAVGVTATISLASSAGAVVMKQDGSRIYVARPNQSGCCSGNDFIEVIDTNTNAVIASIDLGDIDQKAVTAMALSPDGTKLYAVYGNTGGSAGHIAVVDTATNTVSTTYGVSGPTNLFGMAVDSSNRIYVAGNVPFSNPSAAELVIIDGNTGSQINVGTPSGNASVAFNPQRVFGDPAGTKVFVVSTHPSIVLQSFSAGGAALTSTTLGAAPNAHAVSADGSLLYLTYSTGIEVRNAVTLAIVDSIPVGGINALTLNGNTAYAYSSAGATSVLNLTTKAVESSFATGGGAFGGGIAYNSSTNRIFSVLPTLNQVAVIDLNVGSDAIPTAGSSGLVAFNDTPGATLSIPVANLMNAAWNSIDLAATNNISVNSQIRDIDLHSATTSLKLSAGNDIYVNAPIGESASIRFDRDLIFTAGNNINIASSIYQGNKPLVLAANSSTPAWITPTGTGSVNIKGAGAAVTVDTLGSMTITGRDFNIAGGRNTPVTVNVGGLLDANVTGNVLIQAGRATANNGQVGDASVAVTANAISITAGGTITIAGGDSVFAQAEGAGTHTANATANTTVTSATTLALAAGGALTIRGGNNGSAYATNGNNTATTSANATVTAGGAMNLSGASITIRGGDNASAYASSGGNNTAVMSANAAVAAGGPLSLTTPGAIEIRGGDNASATGASAGNNSGTLSASAAVSAPSITLTGGAVTIRGGDFASASAYGSEAATASNLNVNADVHSTGNITVNATSLTVRGGSENSAVAYSSGTHAAALNANASLRADGAMTLNITGPMQISGGDSNVAYAGSGQTAALNAGATVSAGTTLNVSASSLTVRGGDFAFASASSNGVNTAATSVNATLSAGGNMTLASTGGGILVRGGDSAQAFASSGQPGPNTATTNANATVSSGGLLTVNAAGGLTVRGGNDAYASVSSSGVNNATVNANASVLASTMAITVTGPLVIQGGNDALAEASCCGDANTRNTSVVNTNATVRAANGATLTVSGGNVTVAGGDNARASGTEASGEYVATTNARGELSTTNGNLTLNVSGGTLTVRGGDFASASASASSNLARVTSTANASGRLGAGGNLIITAANGMEVRGGHFASADVNGTGSGTRAIASTNADGAIAAGGNITLTSPTLAVSGGNNAFASVSDTGQNSGTVAASGIISAGGNISLAMTGAITVSGGNAAQASASFASGGANTASINAGALISAGGMATVNAGSLSLAGGTQASFEGAHATGTGANTASTLANAAIATGGDLTYTGGSLSVLGGTARTQGNTGTNTAISEANAGMQIAGNKTLGITGGLVITGGSALDNPVNANLGSAAARATLLGSTVNATTSGDVAITGGIVTGIGTADAGLISVGPMGLSVGGSTGMTLTGGAAAPGTGIFQHVSNPVTVTYTAGGATTAVPDAGRQPAYVRTTGPVLVWDGGAGTLKWGDALNWDLDIAPLALHDATVPNLGGITTINMDGPGAVNSVVFLGDESFSINAGGSLAVTSALNIANGTLLLNGGALTGTGAVTAGTFDLAAGTLATSGALTVTSSFSAGGGTFAATGPVSITQAVGNLELPAMNGVASLAAATAAGNITQTGALNILGPSTISAGSGGIALDNPANIFGGPVALANTGANDVTLASATTLTLGNASIGRNLTASAVAGDLDLAGPVTVAGDLSLTAGNHVRVNAEASAAGAVNVSAPFLDITAAAAPARLQAGTGLTVAADEVTVTGGSATGAAAELRAGPGAFNVTTTGNVLLAGGAGDGATARIFGDPDVTMTVGGTIQMTAGAGSGAYAAIESASPASITVTFPSLASGGYFVNGVEGVVHDADTATGFVAGGEPAVLGTNLLVTYGSSPPPPPPPPPPAAPPEDDSALIELANRVLIQAVNQTTTVNTESPAPEEKKDQAPTSAAASSESKPGEEKQKQLPVCK